MRLKRFRQKHIAYQLMVGSSYISYNGKQIPVCLPLAQAFPALLPTDFSETLVSMEVQDNNRRQKSAKMHYPFDNGLTKLW